jgi:peptidoglycan/xylan/chitin deacetylase (PgdA/CDA1 family)
MADDARAMSQAGGQPASWESDPRWGRDHWGRLRQKVTWPRNARVAAVFAVSFEFPDLSFNSQDTSYFFRGAPSYTGAVQQIHIQLYGHKFGVWRLLDLLDRQNVKASFEVNGFVAERFPEPVREISRRGHELVGHFWASNVMHDKVPASRDRELIRRSLAALETVTGRRPSGWVAPAMRLGDATLQHLAAEAIAWHASGLSDDVPYSIRVDGKRMLVLPHSHPHTDDAGFIIGERRSPEVFLEFLKREFSTLYREGATAPKMFNFSVHPELGGRAFMTSVIEEMLVRLKSVPDVWLTTRQQIHDWWIEQNFE